MARAPVPHIWPRNLDRVPRLGGRNAPRIILSLPGYSLSSQMGLHRHAGPFRKSGCRYYPRSGASRSFRCSPMARVISSLIFSIARPFAAHLLPLFATDLGVLGLPEAKEPRETLLARDK